jgi:head-tail adaptor
MSAFTGLLNQSASQYRPTNSQTAIGAESRTWALVQSFPCRLRMLKAFERQMAGQTGVVVTHRLYCAIPATAISEADELRINGVVYDIQSVNDSQGAGHHLEIELLERRPDRSGRG